MDNSYSAIEQRIQTACETARHQKKPNISALARQHEVPVHRLRARFQGRQSRSQRTITTKRLTDLQEAALIRWIDRLDCLHVSPTAGMVAASANAMIQKHNPDADPVGKTWVYDLIQRRLSREFFWVKQKPAERNRIEAEDIGVLQAFYDRLEVYIKSTSPSNIYNFDETGYQLGQGKPQKVITRNPYRTRILSGERGELLTGIECVAADGWVMEPFFVAKGTVHMERWYEGGTLSDESKIAVSPSGYSNDILAINWLEFFHFQTKNRRVRGQKRLLLFDGHGSHLTKEFIELCELWEIVPFIFPAHTTHLVQPLDGSPFRALKDAFRMKNNMIAQWGGDAEDKAFFFREIAGIRAQALKARTIRKAFADRGIYPLNSALVIDRLSAQRSPTPELYMQTGTTPPPPDSSSIPSSPPVSAKEARRVQTKLLKRADKENISPEFLRQLNRVTRIGIQFAEEVGLLNSTIQHQLPAMPSTARKSMRQVGKFGAIVTKDAKRRIGDRAKKEGAAATRKIARAAASEAPPMNTAPLEDNTTPETPIRVQWQPIVTPVSMKKP